MFEDPLFWVFVIPGLLLGLYAQWRIKLNVAKYSQVATQDGITGAEVARRLLDSKGLQNVAVESTPGILSDHYDPRSKTLRLSQQVYFAPSVAAAGIAAHEAGHALQDAEDYFPMEARTYIVPIVQIAAQVAPWLFIIGVLLQYLGRSDPFRVVVPSCHANFAGGVQRECKGARIVGEPWHYTRRRADSRGSEGFGGRRLDLRGSSCICSRCLAFLPFRFIFPGKLG